MIPENEVQLRAMANRAVFAVITDIEAEHGIVPNDDALALLMLGARKSLRLVTGIDDIDDEEADDVPIEEIHREMERQDRLQEQDDEDDDDS